MISRSGKVAAVAFAALLASTASSFGVPLTTPNSVNPGRAGERLAPQKELPSVGAPIAIPSSPSQSAPAGAEAHHFTLTGVSFDGNVALSNEQLAAIAKDYIGRDITLVQVYELASKVTAAYRAEGYILARAIVPTQTISSGVLEIKVIEGFIDKVKVEGDAGGARSMLEEHGRKIAAIRPLTAKVLERELLLAQDLSGFKIRSVLTPSATTPGAADLTMLVERTPFDAYLGADNRGSRYLGPYEITGAAFANDVFHTAGRLGITAVVTPNSGPEMAYGALTYDLPLTASGLRLYALASYTKTHPGDFLSTLGTEGRATTLEADLSYPVIRSRDLNFIVSGGIGSRDSRSEDDLVKPLYNDHVRSVNLGIQGNALDTWGGYSTLSLNYTKGLDIFGASTMSDPNRSRINADGIFSRASFEVTHLQPLIPKVSLLVGATGQTSFGQSLLSSEQFGLGGTFYGRGYDPSELTGDKGLAGKAELRWDVYQSNGFLSTLQLYSFYEGGAVWLEAPLPGEQQRSSLVSAGVGTRLVAWNATHISLEVSKPLTREVAAERDRDARVYFTIGQSF